MKSARLLGRSLAIAAGVAALGGMVPGVVPAATAFAADACGQSFHDYKGTFTGTTLVDGGPQQLTYTLEFPKPGTYVMRLAVLGSSGTHQVQGPMKIVSTQSVGRLMLTVPVFQAKGPTEYMEVTARDTQCEPGLLGTTPPEVTAFSLNLPMGGQEVIMSRTS
ncbi:hypothetical protein [Streptomyces sp. NPDC048001]|uniref:hypothetical protein n=1 Tax=unclassified Streptomyces TaxID=2593676 RepID=UPI003712F634